MITFNLLTKLQKLNPKIYMKNDGIQFRGCNVGGIWLKKRRKGRKALDKGIVKRGHDTNAGHVDIMLAGCPCPDVPEYEVLAPDGENLIRGWRTIVLQCAKKGAFTLQAAKREFTMSLGEQAWDNMDYDRKVAVLQAERDAKQGKILL